MPELISPGDVCWFGFTRVYDDRGYRYLARSGSASAHTSLWRIREKLTLLAHPVPARGVTLYWAARLAFLTCHLNVPDIPEVIRSTGKTLGEISWSLQLPGK